MNNTAFVQFPSLPFICGKEKSTVGGEGQEVPRARMGLEAGARAGEPASEPGQGCDALSSSHNTARSHKRATAQRLSVLWSEGLIQLGVNQQRDSRTNKIGV